MMSKSVGQVLDDHSGIGPGFDVLRISLALLVVLWHEIPIITGDNFAQRAHLLWFGDYAILGAFFALSGFLITASAQRLSLKNFLLNRGLRIFPALLLEITLSALLLGPIFTKLPLREYLGSPETLHYFSNVVGVINFNLPGVFLQNPDHLVNASLWTVPHEILCYIIMSTLVLSKSLSSPKRILWMVGLFVGAGLIMVALNIQAWGPLRVFYARGSQLYTGFLLGIAMWLFRYQLPYSRALAVGCALLCGVVALIGPSQWLAYPVVSLLAGPPLVYLTVFLGATNIPTPVLFRKGDYSYGIYLYGYPIQQSVKALDPRLGLVWLGFGLSLLLLVPFSALSWHLVEKRILGLRKRFSFVARVRDVPQVSREADVSAASVLKPPTYSPVGE